MTPGDVLLDHVAHVDATGLNLSREITVIRMQSGEDRKSERRVFRKMAKDMARRYLSQMEVFNRRGLHSLGDLLSTTQELVSAGKRQGLAKRVAALQRRHGVSSRRRLDLEKLVDDYLAASGDGGEDLRLGIMSVLLERYAKRIPQRSLFDDSEPSRPLSVDAGVADGARIFLLHEYRRPYFFGIDTLCDAGTENAEQFLRLAARLVSQSETRLIRGKDPMLTSGVQHKLLRERAREMVREWDFPEYQLVRRLASGLAAECLGEESGG